MNPNSELSGTDHPIERTATRVLIGIAILVFTWWAWPMLAGSVFFHGDLHYFHLPLRKFYADCLRSGDDFTWFPNIYCGFYIHGEGQGGFCHPLHLILYRCLPLTAAFNLEMFISYAVLFGGMVALLRRLSLGFSSALLGALIFSFSGYNFFHYMHLNSIAVVAHIPWLLAALHTSMLAADARQARNGLTAITLLTASQLLLGHPQSVWFSFLAELTTFIVLWPARTAHFKIYQLIAAKILALLTGCIQLLPTWDALSTSVRERANSDYLTSGSLSPGYLWQMLLPFSSTDKKFSQQEYGVFNGACALVLITWTFIRIRVLGEFRRLALALAILAAFSLLLALGKFGPLYWIQQLLPLIGGFRAPSRYVALVHLAGAVVAAIALADLAGIVRHRQAAPWSRSAMLLLWPIASIIAAVVFSSGTALPLASSAHIAVRIGFFAAAVLCVIAASRGYGTGLILLLLVVMLEVFHGFSLVTTPSAAISALIAVEPELSETADYRVVNHWGNMPAMKGVRLANGLSGLPPKRILRLKTQAPLEAAGVRWAWGRAENDAGAETTADFIRVPNPIARVHFVTRTRPLAPEETPATAIENLNLQEYALVAEPVALEDAANPGKATLEIDRPGRIKVLTAATGKQFLVLAEAFHPGWHASIDGHPAPIIRANGDFMGCVVNDGAHAVDFHFRPRSFTLGAWLTALGLVLIAARFLWNRRATLR